MLITKKKHVAVVKGLQQDVRALEATAKLYQQQRNIARAEAEANKADAEELARWRQYGQMRDPATGRLIPRVKAEVANV